MLLITSAVVSQNPTPFNKIKITGNTENNGATWILVQDAVSKEVHRIAKTSITDAFIPITGTDDPVTGPVVLNYGGAVLTLSNIGVASTLGSESGFTIDNGGFLMFNPSGTFSVSPTAMSFFTLGVTPLNSLQLNPYQIGFSEAGGANHISISTGNSMFDLSVPRSPELRMTREGANIHVTAENAFYTNVNPKFPALWTNEDSRTLTAAVKINGTRYYSDVWGEVDLGTISGGGGVSEVTGTDGVTVATGTTTPVIGLGNITPDSVTSDIIKNADNSFNADSAGNVAAKNISGSGIVSGASYSSDGSVSDAELKFINSVTSNVQNQIDLKANASALTNLVNKTVANTYTAGAKQTFAGNSTSAGVGFGGGLTANPSSLSTGDFWFRSDEGKFRYYDGSVARAFVTEALAQTLTNKTLVDPIVGTQAASDNSTKAASTAFVKTETDNLTHRFVVNDAHVVLPTWGTTTLNVVSGLGYTVAGSGALRNFADTNLFTRTQRTAWATTSTAGTTNSGRQITGYFTRNTEFEYITKFGSADNASTLGNRAYIGISKANETNAPEPSVMVNCVGMVMLASSTNWHIIHNDASGTATTIDLGSDYPANTVSTDMYQLKIKTVSTGIEVTVKRLGTAFTYTTTLTTDIPAASQVLATYIAVNNNTNAAVFAVDWAGHYIKMGI